MSQMYELIRELRPEDAFSVAKIHITAFPEDKLSTLGLTFVEHFYSRCFALDETICLGIERNGLVVGFVCGGPEGFQKTVIKKSMLAAAQVIVLQPWLFWRLLLKFSSQPSRPSSIVPRIEGEPTRVSPKHLSSPTFLLKFIAVDQTARNTGCSAKLMTEFEKKAYKEGARSIIVGVLSTNLLARRVYVRQGMFPVAYGKNWSWIRYAKILNS